jgi:hypothetical protein
MTEADMQAERRKPARACRNCEWFEGGVFGDNTGRCRARTPTDGGWPFVKPLDWCAHFTPDPQQFQEADEY